MRISVILPVLNEERAIGPTIAAVMALHPNELIVVDGGSSDDTRKISAQSGAKVLMTGPGRARQMNRGALDATGDVLLFLKVVGFMISLRSRLSKVGTGDQAIFVRREIFTELGAFPDMPLMEDIAFSRMLKRAGKVACLKSKVVTSARRWETDGVWRTIFRMWTLKLLHFAGVSPARLKRFYADTR